MSTRVTERRPSSIDTSVMRRRLQLHRRDLESQMRAATADLHRLRTTTDVSDPDVQPALMAALRSLDSSEREAIEVADALVRLADGRLGRCERCGSGIDDELILARPLTRTCHRCDQ
jgi:RNA polymerase-binding transcription factor DksA